MSGDTRVQDCEAGRTGLFGYTGLCSWTSQFPPRGTLLSVPIVSAELPAMMIPISAGSLPHRFPGTKCNYTLTGVIPVEGAEGCGVDVEGPRPACLVHMLFHLGRAPLSHQRTSTVL